MSLPKRVLVTEVITSRYVPGTKPQSWDKRVDGFDVVKTSDSEVFALASLGAQSTPATGWTLLITEQVGETDLPKLGIMPTHKWTLYGIAKS